MKTENITVLIVEDEPSMREMLEMALKKTYTLRIASDLKHGLSELERGGIDLILTDVKLPDGTGLDLIARAKTVPERPPILLMTAFGSTDMAVEAMKLGAFHYLTKPFKLDELHMFMTRALESTTKAVVAEGMIGTSAVMRSQKAMIDQVAKTKTNVLITGESGTGKELIARAIHYGGILKSKPFVTVNCGAIPENLMESEMFGHRRGSFTGAVVDKEGLFQVAHQGTIFLDEVGELPLGIQVKLLRVLQDRSFHQVGGTESIKVDVRVVSATNRNLEAMVASGTFREDLYYRLNVINIHSPPLRERREDIPLLIEHFLTKFSISMGKKVLRMTPAAMNILKNYEFPGNIRELQNVMERAVALEGRGEITEDSLPPLIRKRVASQKQLAPLQKQVEASVNAFTTSVASTMAPQEAETMIAQPIAAPLANDLFAYGPIDLENIVGELEKKYILKALEKSDGVKKEAARLLGITFRSFRYRVAKYGMAESDEAIPELESDDL